MQTQIGNYKIIETIYDGSRNIVYRAKKDDNSYVIKAQRDEFPRISETTRFKQEFELLQNLNIDGILQVEELIKLENRYAAVFKDFDGQSLDIAFTDSVNIKQFLDIAIQSTKILSEIHRARVIHKDIKPQNIVINPSNAEIQIIDFGSASKLSKENPTLINTGALEGTLAYISPEQTGRMNRNIDYRTDFYSLGITFYKLLTATLPFNSQDPIELIHSHMAISPTSPNEKNNKIPLAISNIVMKLLAKTPEDRYQSANGLIYDLEWCKKNPDQIEKLQIGKYDVSEKFQIPEKLYGRETDMEILLESFKKVSETEKNGMILIAGPSGMGKSALIREIYKPITKTRGYFILGKYDQFKKDLPYSAIIQAFTELTRQLLSEDKLSISKWKENILNALGENAGVMTELISELELIIGKQEAPASLPPTEAQNRFIGVITEFVKVFATKAHPLAIFFDDMQWADAASLNLLKLLYTDSSISSLFIICSYRDNEVDDLHPFILMLGDIKKENLSYELLRLSPLRADHVSKLIGETLYTDPENVKELAYLVHAKTGGNPFFVTELLKSLHKDDMILPPSLGEKNWKWDITKIKSVKITDNVVELMSSKIQKLPEQTIQIMKIASCIGSKFYLDNLSVMSDLTEEEILNRLSGAIDEGMILIGGNSSQFAHDRVREATYKLMEPKEKEENHYRMGNLLLKNTPPAELADRLFAIVGQLNLSHNLIQAKDERLNLVELNLKAGKKAKASTAYDGALGFLQAGISLLPDDCWKKHYELTMELYKELAECEYLATHFEKADKLYDYIYENAQSLLDKVPIYHIQLRQKASEQKAEDAFKIGFDVLSQLGLEMPDSTDAEAVGAAFGKHLGEYKELLGEKSISEIYYLSEMKDRNMIEAIQLITNLGDIAIAMKPDMLGIATIIGVVLSLKYGNTEVSPISYVMMGVITNLAFKDYNTGYELGQLALKLSQEKFSSEQVYCKVMAFYSWNINHWLHHLKEDLEYARKGFELTMKNSDLVYASYYVLMEFMPRFALSSTLKEVEEYGEKCFSFADKHKIGFVRSLTTPTQRITLALQGLTKSYSSFEDDDYNEEAYVNENQAFGQPMAYHYLRKIQLYFIMGEYNKALEVFPEMDKFFPEIPQHIGFAEVHFANVLVYLMVKTELTEKQIEELSPKFDSGYEYLKLWAGLCTDNFEHQLLLVEAEIARLDGRDMDAMDAYNKSIESAKKYGYTQNAAIASELAGKFYLTKNMPKVAMVYLQDAHYLFLVWGAVAKSKLLETKYPSILKQPKSTQDSTATIMSTTMETVSSATTHTSFDVNSIMKASRVLSGEIELDKLLEKLMRILFEEVGAEKGFLMLVDKDDKSGEENLLIEAEGDVNKKESKVLTHTPIHEAHLPMAIINFVSRTKKFIVLDDATNQGNYTKDHYIQEIKPKSILCYPVLNKGKLVALIYLENNLATSVFNEQRLEIMTIIASQLAISMENAKLLDQIVAVTEEKARVGMAMEIARDMQTCLLPTNPKINGYEISAFMETCDEVGGDYYDVVNYGGFDWLVIGDVSGHGVKSGMVMMMVQVAIHTAMRYHNPEHSLEDLLQKVNNVITSNITMMQAEKYMTLTLFLVDQNKLYYAGLHQPVIIYRAKEDKVEQLETEGSWLGYEDMMNDYPTMNFELNSGDTLILFTDGVSEAVDKDDKMFDDIGIRNFMQKYGMKPTKEMQDEFLEELKNYENEDDITFVFIKKS